MFPIEMVGNLMMPSVANKKSLEMITPLQARKAFLAMAGSVILTIPFGIVVGLVFFRLYKPAYFEHIWRYFIVILAATALYPIQTFSRPYLIKFFKAHYIIVSQFVAVVLQITVSMVLLAKYNNAMGAAIGRAVGIAAVSFIFYFICQTHIFKIAFKSMKTRS
jgi:O-antigen/teichoic acid export membrane protein